MWLGYALIAAGGLIAGGGIAAGGSDLHLIGGLIVAGLGAVCCTVAHYGSRILAAVVRGASDAPLELTERTRDPAPSANTQEADAPKRRERWR